MKFYDRLPAILAGTAITSAIVIVQTQAAVALTGIEVNDIAREVTVLCVGTQEQHGSGVIVAKDGNTYYVLTANHVVAVDDDYKIVTPDKQAYAIEGEKIQQLPGVDLAVVQFTSDKKYRVAKLVNSDLAKEGQSVFVSGWPIPGAVGRASGKQTIRQFTDGRISGFLETPVDGYQMIYTNVTRKGMSGAPVLDAGGRLVGIHGLGDYEDPNLLQTEGLTQEAATSIASLIKPGFNYAIPINTFLRKAPQAGLYLGLQVENSPAPELGEPYVASAEPDPRDTIDDLNTTLETVNRVFDTVDIFRRIFD